MDPAGTSYMGSSEATNVYEYAALEGADTVRVLELLPGTNEPLQCKLSHFKLRLDARFEALSYAWGKPEFPNTLRIVTPDSFLKITNNLKDALQALRLSKVSRLLWVDAVCINQADDEEKAELVGKMKEIYQDAHRVIVWLGKGADDPKTVEIQRKGLAELEEIGRNCGLYGVDKIFPFPHWIKDRSALENLKKLIREASLLTEGMVYASLGCPGVRPGERPDPALRELMYRLRSLHNLFRDSPYGTNGIASLLMDVGFNQAWQLIQQRERYWGMSATQYSMSPTQRSVYGYEDLVVRPSSIIEYCAFAKELECTKKVDRIYGMLGFAHDSGLTVAVDYKSSPEKVWETLARETLLLGDLTVLHYAGMPVRGESRVKSFASDFGHWEHKGERLGGHGHPRFHAATAIPPKVELEPNGCVRVHAIKVDSVYEVGFVYEKVNNDPAVVETSSAGDASMRWQSSEYRAATVNESLASRFKNVSQDVVLELYQWWMFWLKADGPRWYNDRTGELAFRRTIIADGALPGMQALISGNLPIEGLDLLFVIYMLAKDATDEDGNKNCNVDTWKVYEWMGEPRCLCLSTFTDDPNPPTYFFPTFSEEEAVNRFYHALLSLEIEHQRPGALMETGVLTMSGKDRTIEITSPLKEQLDNYMVAISKILSERNMFITKLRMLGIGPKGMQPGDVIMVPEGSQTPFVYRHAGEPDGYVRKAHLIGECYVHGLMDGSPVEALRENYEGSHIEVILM